jgi:hypothetical protein
MHFIHRGQPLFARARIIELLQIREAQLRLQAHEQYWLNVAAALRWHHGPPYRLSSYNAVRGVTWTVVDVDGVHVATVYEEEAARLIVQRLNE